MKLQNIDLYQLRRDTTLEIAYAMGFNEPLPKYEIPDLKNFKQEEMEEWSKKCQEIGEKNGLMWGKHLNRGLKWLFDNGYVEGSEEELNKLIEEDGI